MDVLLYCYFMKIIYISCFYFNYETRTDIYIKCFINYSWFSPISATFVYNDQNRD